MQIFNSGFFWFAEGILFCLVLIGFRAWALGRGIPLPAWKWVALLVWLLIAGFTIAFIGTSLGENEPTAAVRGGLLFGLITVIAGVGLWRLLLIGAGGQDPREQEQAAG
jgi:hypothetical protein